MFRPQNPILPWATLDSWSDPGQPWDGASNCVSPGALTPNGFLPGQHPAAEHLNYLVKSATQWAEYARSLAELQILQSWDYHQMAGSSLLVIASAPVEARYSGYVIWFDANGKKYLYDRGDGTLTTETPWGEDDPPAITSFAEGPEHFFGVGYNSNTYGTVFLDRNTGAVTTLGGNLTAAGDTHVDGRRAAVIQDIYVAACGTGIDYFSGTFPGTFTHVPIFAQRAHSIACHPKTGTAIVQSITGETYICRDDPTVAGNWVELLEPTGFVPLSPAPFGERSWLLAQGLDAGEEADPSNRSWYHKIWISHDDGATWTIATSHTGLQFVGDILATASSLVCLSEQFILASFDGLNWTKHYWPGNCQVYDDAWGGHLCANYCRGKLLVVLPHSDSTTYALRVSGAFEHEYVTLLGS